MKSKLWFIPVFFTGTIVDQVTKVLAFSHLKESESYQLIPNFLGFVLSRNKGALFGVFQDQVAWLAVLSVVAMAMILWFLYKAPAGNKSMPIALGFVGAGAIGNLIDRIFYGSVRDFIDMSFGGWHWPTYNIADVCICIGVGIIIYFEMTKENAEKKAATNEK